MRTRRHTIAHMAQIVTVLIATVAAVAVSPATLPAASLAASHGNFFLDDAPEATEVVLATAPHPFRPAESMRSLAQLTVPAGSHWETQVSGRALLLTVASGGVKVAISDGTARIVDRSGSDTLQELTPGESVVLFARDRLVMHGPGSLIAQNVSQDPVVAAVIRIS